MVMVPRPRSTSDFQSESNWGQPMVSKDGIAPGEWWSCSHNLGQCCLVHILESYRLETDPLLPLSSLPILSIPSGFGCRSEGGQDGAVRGEQITARVPR
jgi:hypothetical protein